MSVSPTIPKAVWISFALIAASGPLAAESITLRPVADTELSEQSPNSNSGNATEMVIGTQGPTAGNPRNRALIKFDLAGQIQVPARFGFERWL